MSFLTVFSLNLFFFIQFAFLPRPNGTTAISADVSAVLIWGLPNFADTSRNSCGDKVRSVDYWHSQNHGLTVCQPLYPGGKLIDLYDGGDHVRPFSQTPKYADQIFERPQICWPNFQKPPKIMLTNSFLNCFLLAIVFWNTFLSRDPNLFTKIFFLSALKISDPKYDNLPSILDPKYFF